MADRTLPDLVGPKAWRQGNTWSLPTRWVAALTVFTFTFLQLALPFSRAEEPVLPDWLKEENGGWVSQEQAGRMQRADQELLNFLSTLQQAQATVTTHPSGLKTQYVHNQPVVAKDNTGNLLWSPTLDDYQRVENGTLLLVDGTLQVVKDGQLARQVDVMGNETVFREDGRADYEIAADGTHTDYSYSETGFTRTTHLPDGSLLALTYSQDSAGAITGITAQEPDGTRKTYASTGEMLSSEYFESFTSAQPNGFTLQGAAVQDGQLVVTGTGGDLSANAAHTRSWTRSDSETTFTLPFVISASDSKTTVSLEGTNASGAYRRIELHHKGSKLQVQTVTGTKTSNPAVALGSVALGETYWAKFTVTSSGTSVYAWKEGENEPSSPAYTWTLADWNPNLHFWVKTGTLKIDQVNVHTAAQNSQETLSPADRAPAVSPQDGLWNTGSWPLLPPAMEPPPLPEGQQLTQTLTNGMTATWVDGTLAEVVTPEGARLLHPELDTESRVQKGWLSTPDGTLTYIDAGVPVWSKDVYGTVTWFTAQGRVAATQARNGTVTGYTYDLDAAGEVTAIHVTMPDAALLLDPEGRTLEELRGDGRRLVYHDGRLSRIEMPGQPDIVYTETLQPEGSLLVARPELAEGQTTDLPQHFLYDSAGKLIEVLQDDGSTIRFQDGLPVEVMAVDGSMTTLTVEQSGDLLSGLRVTRDGITRSYNLQGGLASLDLSDQTTLTLAGEAIQGVHLPDDARISDGVYDSESRLVSGTVTMPDGQVIRYADGLPVEATLPDGSRVTYTGEQPTGLTLPDGARYSLTHGEESIRAELVENPASGTDVLTEMTYSSDWVLQQATRSDGALLVYSGGRLSTLTQADGTVISYAYDEAGRLANTVAASPDAAEPLIRSEYAYDRIRKIYKGDELLYDYTYAFEADGTEITLVRELETGLQKKYRGGLLLSQTDPDGAVTTYEYSNNPSGFQDPYQTAVGAMRTLADGTVAHYGRSSAGAWTLSKFTLTDGTEILPEQTNPTDHLGDYASLEAWSNGPQQAPDGWKVGADPGGLLAQETNIENIHSGSTSVKLTTGSGGGDSFIYRDIAPMYSEQLVEFEGKTVTLGAWVKTSNPGAYLGVLDGVLSGVSRSEDHPGDGQWHFLTVTRVNGTGGLSKLVAFLNTNGPNNTAYFDDAVFIIGPAVLTRDFSGLLAEAALPSDPATLRRMAELGALTLIQPENSNPPAPAEGGSPTLTRSTVSYQGKTRETFTYRYTTPEAGVTLSHITDSSGTIRTYNGQRLIAIEQADGTRHEVTYGRDLSEAQAQLLASLPAGDPQAIAILSNPDGEEIVTHRLVKLATANGSVITSDFPAETVVRQVFDSAGMRVSSTQANGQVTLYEDGRPIQTLDAQGRPLTEYLYDETGRLIKISLAGARRDLAVEIASARADLARRQAAALEDLARQKGLVIQDLKDHRTAIDVELSNQMNKLKLAWSDIIVIDAQGKAGEQAKGGAMNQILDAQRQIYVAMEEADRQYAQSLGQLESQVESVRQQVETESVAALGDIDAKEREFGLEILRQEISTIVISAYRNTIGRDPSRQELDQEAQRLYDLYGANPEAAIDLEDLTQRITALPDYAGRAAQVASIKQSVTTWLTHYVQADPANRAELIEALGLSADQVVNLSESDVQRIIDWLNSRSLHFGHSAFLALREFLGQSSPSADTLAGEAILTDILVGVITPKAAQEADLEISLFTLGHLARRHGTASATPAKVSFDDLKELGTAIAHVNGNHYIVIRSIAADGTVTYSEPNSGPTGEVLTMTRAEFEKTWDGAILAARAPPHVWQVLTDSEAQRITGSFFPLIFVAIAWVASAITAAVSAVIGAITAIIAGLSTLVSGIFSVVGAAFNAVGTFLGGFGSFFSGLGAITQGLGGIFAGNLLGGIGAIIEGLTIALPGGFLSIGLNIGVTKGLEALGVSPTIASLAGAFVSGGVTGALNPVGVSSSFLSNFVSSGLTSTAIAGTQIGLVKAGLDPTLAGIASIGVGTIAGSMLSGVTQLNSAGEIVRDAAGNPVIIRGTAALSQTLHTSLAPTLAGELAFYGVQQLGASLGLDPRISQLAGMPISSAVRATVTPGRTIEGVTHAIWEGLKSGAVSVGTQMTTQALGLDPFAGSLISRTISGTISGAISPSHNVFQGVYNAFRDSVGNFSTIPPPPDPNDPRFIKIVNGNPVWDGQAYNAAIGQYEASRPVWMAQAMAKTNDFSEETRQLGFAQAIENYATSIFHRDSVEYLVQSFGSVKDAITERMRQNKIKEVTLEDGTLAKELALFDDETLKLLYKEDPFGEVSLLGITEDDLDRRYYEARADRETNSTVMSRGFITQTYMDGDMVTARVRQEIEGADIKQITIQDETGNTYTIAPNSFQHVRLNSDGSIRDGVLTHSLTGTTLIFENGDLTQSLDPVNPLEMSNERKSALAERYGLSTGQFDGMLQELKSAAQLPDGRYDWSLVYPHLDENVAWDLFHPSGVLVGTLYHQAIAEADAEAAQQPSFWQKTASFFEAIGQKVQGSVDWYKANVLGATDPKIQEQLQQRILAEQPDHYDGDERPTEISLVAGRGSIPSLQSPQFAMNQVQWRLDPNNEVVIIDTGEKIVAMGIAAFRGFVSKRPDQTPESLAQLMAWRYKDQNAATKINALVGAFGSLNAAVEALQSGEGVYHIRLERYGTAGQQDTDRYRWSVLTEQPVFDQNLRKIDFKLEPIRDYDQAKRILDKFLEGN